ncbi:HAD-IA family hydrolase [Sabulilitoribacter arenilitoris]|uniref:HAD-IA family hydrolase n=1 Tax=Wocania arenilitoris TaxID=2044858 RepID=A0AAE3EMQ5_9FLAO|nr:HAD-IA family hydrolase [Wocania arenilitoris]MCF7567717.1 HAD-IA family hydrolase [Wocania arenilitoris]
MSKYKCVIFDCDGVLVDSETIGNQVFVDMANELGANIDLQYATKHFKGGFLQNSIEHISKLIDSEIPQSFEEEYRKRSFDAFKSNIKPIQGILEVLQNIKRPFCVASSGPESKIKLNLELTGLLPYFENNIFSSYTIQKWKPDPGIFLLAAETMGYKPSECIIIEDSLSGVKAAINGGFDVFGFTMHDYDNELKTLATKTFDNMNDLLKMI